MTEAGLLKAVTGICEDWGLWCYHNAGFRTASKKGFPDLVILGHGMLFRELKSGDGSVKVAQSDVGRRIEAAGGNWAVWRPEDLESGRIQRELRRITDCPMAPAK